jgi:hypothetical protein
MPSGRGFYSGSDYFLPLTSAEVARIDLKKGEIAERARSRSGNRKVRTALMRFIKSTC